MLWDELGKAAFRALSTWFEDDYKQAVIAQEHAAQNGTSDPAACEKMRYINLWMNRMDLPLFDWELKYNPATGGRDFVHGKPVRY